MGLPIDSTVDCYDLVSGCGQVLVALGGADAVILQSEIAIDGKIGLSYEGKTIHTLLEKREEPWEYRVEGKTDYQFSPYVIYVSGIEDDEPLEYYIIGDERYEKVDSNEWDKIALELTKGKRRSGKIGLILRIHDVTRIF